MSIDLTNAPVLVEKYRPDELLVRCLFLLGAQVPALSLAIFGAPLISVHVLTTVFAVAYPFRTLADSSLFVSLDSCSVNAAICCAWDSPSALD